MTERGIPETAMRLIAMIVVRSRLCYCMRLLLYAHMVRLAQPSWQDLYFDEAFARETLCGG